MKTWLLASTFLVGMAAMAPEAAKPLKNPPLAYFESHCARCHGGYGSNYGADFGKGKSVAQIRKVVEDMASGPGGQALTGIDLDSQTAFHEALIAKKPFVDWAAMKDGVLSGEITPKATVQIVVGQKRIDAKIDEDGNWTATLPAGVMPKDVVIEAKSGKVTTTLPLATRSFPTGR